MNRRVLVTFCLVGLSVVLMGATCSSQRPRPKPRKFDLRFRLAPALVGSTVQIDVVGPNTRSYQTTLETIALSDYWNPDNVTRREAPKAPPIVFTKGGPQEQTFRSTDPKWNSWLDAGVNVLVIMVDAPGKQSRITESIDGNEWGDVTTIEFLVQESGIVLVT